MDIVFVLLPASIFLALLALVAFFWAVKEGQFRDMNTPSRRILHDDLDQITQDKEEKGQKK